MTTVTVAGAKSQFSDLLRRAEYGRERFVVERHGKPVAVIVSTDDLKLLEALEEAADVRDARAALREAEEHGTIPLDVVLRKHQVEHLLDPSRSPVAARPRRTVRSSGRTRAATAPETSRRA